LRRRAVVQLNTKPSRKRNLRPLPSRKKRERRVPKLFPQFSYITDKGDVSRIAKEFHVNDITNIPRPVGWVVRKTNAILGLRGPHVKNAVPYIDERAQNTGYTMYTTVTEQTSFFYSYLATRFKRIRSVVRKDKDIKRSRKRAIMNTGFRAVLLSTVAQDDYILNRYLAIRKRPDCPKIINGMISKFLTKISDDKWFVYRHVSSYTKWLDLRGNRPRDKLMVRDETIKRANTFGRQIESSTYFMSLYQNITSLARGVMFRNIRLI
jgi:hypothetical protein